MNCNNNRNITQNEHQPYNNKNEIDDSSENIESDLYAVEGGTGVYTDVEQKEDDDNSLPLLIVGNKIDKLSATEKLALQTACAQQVFVVSLTDNFTIFHEY